MFWHAATPSLGLVGFVALLALAVILAHRSTKSGRLP